MKNLLKLLGIISLGQLNVNLVLLKNTQSSLNDGEFQKESNKISQRDYNPSYPSIDESAVYKSGTRFLLRKDSTFGGMESNLPNLNSGVYEDFSKTTGSNSEWTTVTGKEIYRVNVLKYAPSKSEFIKKYSKAKLYLGKAFWATGYGSGSGAGFTNDLRYPDASSDYYSFTLTSSSQTITIYSGNKGIKHFSLKLLLTWSGNNISIKPELKGKIAWAAGSSTKSSLFIGIRAMSISFTSAFKMSDIESKLSSQLNTSSSFVFNSDTTSKLNSIVPNVYTQKSNKELVEDEVIRRVKLALGSEYDLWIGSNGLLKINMSYENAKKVTVSFNSNGSSGQVSSTYNFTTSMPVTVKLTDLYWANTLNSRIEVFPGKIVDPLSLENELIVDRPEFLLSTNTFIYHNSLEIQFVAENPSQILYVNGNEIPVINNVYTYKLTDTSDSGKGSAYKVKATNLKGDSGDLKDAELNININSNTTNMNFRWQGWNPDISDEQYNLVNQKDKYGNFSETYDPTIDKDTGMRKKVVFINDSLNNYPFFQDPIDKYGNLVDDNTKPSERNYGLIAEALVANSGVTLLENIDKTYVYKIEMVQIDIDSLTEIKDTKKDVTNSLQTNEQYSNEGLYHYIIYMKDYVEKEVTPNEVPTQDVSSTSGSTLHKLLYIDKNEKSYANFNDLEFVKNSGNYKEFFSTVPGRHFKNYLINSLSFTSKMIEQLEYEQIIKYWKMFVSEAKAGDTNIDGNNAVFTDVSNLVVNTIKFNSTNIAAVREKIKASVKESFLRQYNLDNVVYGEDFSIENENGTMLDKIDFSKFIDINENNKFQSMKLFVKISSTSAIIENKNDELIPFDVINNYDFEEDRVLDLSKIREEYLSYNFTNASDEVKQNFLKNYIIDYSKKIIDVNNSVLPNPWSDENGGQIKFLDDYYILIIINGSEFEINDQVPSSDLLEALENYFLSENITTLEVNVISSNNSIRLVNSVKYYIENNPDSNEVPPLVPEEPTPSIPKEDETTTEGGGGIIETESSQKNRGLLWLISLIIPVGGLIGFLIWWKKNRVCKKIK